MLQKQGEMVGRVILLFWSTCVNSWAWLHCEVVKVYSSISMQITGKALQLVSSPLQLGKGITKATVYTNPLFYYSIKVPEQ
jgi:hypothetical protein